ncbi:hypothetical protein [Paenibacillus gallinarum]|uniref:Uncharacterized protein n=1 Tax=Paenibacillus gallinarum TaxID=2762232 RepID=A0ABR8T0B2_9BACL|nr:hypothetical protein [Paenibacillus gallinarum]MBD7969117.1 hypothetical protein [Paenibacillus gallinarum]
MKKPILTTLILFLVLAAGGIASVIVNDHAIITPAQVVSALENKNIQLLPANESADKPTLNHVPAVQYIVQPEQATGQPEALSIFTYASADALQDALAELEQQISYLDDAPAAYEHKNALILYWKGDSSSDSLNKILEEALLDL